MKKHIVKHTLELMKANSLIEVRVVGKQTYSGYFTDIDLLIQEIEPFEKDNIYFVMNEINEACYSREQKDKMYQKPKNTTSDTDIVKRDWLLIDIDSKRSTGVSSTDEEKKSSSDVANKVFSYLRDIGFCEPICTDSGNGYHLLYKINVNNDSESKTLIQNFLKVLDMYFTVEGAEIDKTVFNASRITKLYGTTARKGRSTTERPHRDSKILKVPDSIKVTPIELIKKVAQQLPERDKPDYKNNYGNDDFDLDSFIQKHSINITSERPYGDGIKYSLDSCFFDDNHKGNDACLFKTSNGAIGYKCFHNSCSEHKWKDVRLIFEPDAYQKNYVPSNRITKKIPLQPQVEEEKKGKKFQSLSEIESIDRSKIVTIPSGFSMLDRKIIGFNKGEVSVWSGKNGSAKSTVLNQIVLNGIQRGFKFVVFSGELTGNRIKDWFHLQASGRQYTKPTMWEGAFSTPPEISKKIDKWLDNKLWIYNNDYGNKFDQLILDIEEMLSKNDIDSIVIDNLMTVDILSLDGFKNEKQTTFINRISKFAKDRNIHIHLVAHPRKNVGFLRKEDISGTADLTNAVDNVIICHRNNIDFQKTVTEFFPVEMSEFLSKYSNYIEVCKNRDLGVIDHLVGLHYEIESKRLLNNEYDNICYDWQEPTTIPTNVKTPPSDYNPNAGIEPNKEEFESLDFDDLEGSEESPF